MKPARRPGRAVRGRAPWRSAAFQCGAVGEVGEAAGRRSARRRPRPAPAPGSRAGRSRPRRPRRRSSPVAGRVQHRLQGAARAGGEDDQSGGHARSLGSGPAREPGPGGTGGPRSRGCGGAADRSDFRRDPACGREWSRWRLLPTPCRRRCGSTSTRGGTARSPRSAPARRSRAGSSGPAARPARWPRRSRRTTWRSATPSTASPTGTSRCGRLQAMLDHEFQLNLERLDDSAATTTRSSPSPTPWWPAATAAATSATAGWA